jgi:hypothetical protein
MTLGLLFRLEGHQDKVLFVQVFARLNVFFYKISLVKSPKVCHTSNEYLKQNSLLNLKKVHETVIHLN